MKLNPVPVQDTQCESPYLMETYVPLPIPERRGNNRIDTFKNILSDPHVSLLFLIQKYI